MRSGTTDKRMPVLSPFTTCMLSRLESDIPVFDQLSIYHLLPIRHKLPIFLRRRKKTYDEKKMCDRDIFLMLETSISSLFRQCFLSTEGHISGKEKFLIYGLQMLPSFQLLRNQPGWLSGERVGLIHWWF